MHFNEITLAALLEKTESRDKFETISVERDEESLDLRMKEWLNTVYILKVLINGFVDRPGMSFEERGKI